jgi:chitinase
MASDEVGFFKGAGRRPLFVLVLASILSTFLLLSSTGHSHHVSTLSRRVANPSTDLDFPDGSNGTSVSELRRRQDDYSCGPGRPCKNHACCGASGFCGYGQTYCGPGCTSNCDAHAECGKDAVVPGAKCPLNTCCSEFGFVSLFS